MTSHRKDIQEPGQHGDGQQHSYNEQRKAHDMVDPQTAQPKETTQAPGQPRPPVVVQDLPD